MGGGKVGQVELHLDHVGGAGVVPGGHDEGGVASRIVLVDDKVPLVVRIDAPSVLSRDQVLGAFEPTVLERVDEFLFGVAEATRPEQVHIVELLALDLVELNHQFEKFLVVVLPIGVCRGDVECPHREVVHAAEEFPHHFESSVLSLGVGDEVLEVPHGCVVTLVAGYELGRLLEATGIRLSVLQAFARGKLGNGILKVHAHPIGLEGETGQILVYGRNH